MAGYEAAAGFEVRVRWRSAIAGHVDTVYVAERAAPPVAVARAVMAGDGGFEPVPDVRPPARDAGRVFTLPSSSRRWRLGRFYDAGDVRRALCRPDLPVRRPLRCVALGRGCVGLDGNHPLAAREVSFLARGLDASVDTRTRVAAALSRLLAGAGMQAPLDDAFTDFGDDDAWRRDDEQPDRRFYAPPRLVMHLDAAAVEVLHALHASLLPRDARLLDLMASWRSPLPAVTAPCVLVGLGMNEIELSANTRLTGRVVHDLNRRPALPFVTGSFDAAVCSVSVDYLCRPGEVFAELARVITGGGLLVVSFSDRCFPSKAVRLWRRLHDFERMGLVLELFRRAGFTHLQSWSLRGLPRPADDRHGGNSLVSDPVYAVWGRSPAV